jgi:hypothetical protein
MSRKLPTGPARQRRSASVRDEAATWVHYELQFLWREAQAEADLAYRAWSRHPGREGYVVYRAARDRADTAQDELAAWMSQRKAVRSPPVAPSAFG